MHTQRYWMRSGLVLALLILGAVALLGERTVGPRPAQVALAADAPTSTLPPSSIIVGGSADVQVPPDMATVSFGALAIRANAQDALIAVNQVIAAAVVAMHRLQIPDRRIQTAQLSLDPRYDSANNLTGYQATETLIVITTSLGKVGRIVDAGVGAGANTNVSISFGLTDEAKVRLSALKQAIAVAQGRAEAAAQALGRSLKGAHVQLTENGQSITFAPRAALPAVADGTAAGSTVTFGGTLTIHEDVTLTYTF